MVSVLAGERQAGETSKATQACNDYLRLGPGRSLRILAAKYTDLPQNATPTRSFNTLGAWSTRYAWQARAEEYDTELEARKNAEAEAVMSEGLALPYERVRMLKEMAADLQPLQIRAGIKRGEEIKIIDPAVVAQLRGTLDDLAKETGGRVKKQEVSGPGGGPMEITNVELTDAERAAGIDAIFDAARARRDRQDGEAGLAEDSSSVPGTT